MEHASEQPRKPIRVQPSPEMQQVKKLQEEAYSAQKKREEEPRVDERTFVAIAREAAVRYQIANIKNNAYMNELESKIHELEQLIAWETGIPLSRVPERLREFEDLQNIPREYIDQAIKHRYPSHKEIVNALDDLGGLPRKRAMQEKMSKIMTDNAQQCIAALEQANPMNTYSYTIARLPRLFPWNMPGQVVRIYEQTPELQESLFSRFRPRGKKIAQVKFNGDMPNSVYTVKHSVDIYTSSFLVTCKDAVNTWRHRVNYFDYWNRRGNVLIKSPKWKTCYHCRLEGDLT